MTLKTRIQLSMMMFVEYFIWGAWFVTMGTYLTRIGFQGTDIGNAYSTTAWAAIISSFFVGLVADKYFAAEKLTGVLHVIGGLLLFWVSKITTPGYFFWILLLYTICYMPTIALTNAISFNQTKNAGQDFPLIRVLGTIGWIAAGLVVGLLKMEFGSQPMQIAAVVSMMFGLYCFFLPHTPPQSKEKRATIRDILGLDALKLMKDRSYAALILSALCISIPFACYHNFANMSLNEMGVANAAAKMTLGQAAEIIFMLLMPFFFVRLGVKKMLSVGMFCWTLRYALFALGCHEQSIIWLYFAILLHGICYDFFFVTSQIYVDNKAPADLRASVQGFLTFITYGVGWLVGAWASGVILQKYQILDQTGMVIGHNWPMAFAIPSVIALFSLLIFLLLFKEAKVQSH